MLIRFVSLTMCFKHRLKFHCFSSMHSCYKSIWQSFEVLGCEHFRRDKCFYVLMVLMASLADLFRWLGHVFQTAVGCLLCVLFPRICCKFFSLTAHAADPACADGFPSSPPTNVIQNVCPLAPFPSASLPGCSPKCLPPEHVSSPPKAPCKMLSKMFASCFCYSCRSNADLFVEYCDPARNFVNRLFPAHVALA